MRLASSPFEITAWFSGTPASRQRTGSVSHSLCQVEISIEKGSPTGGGIEQKDAHLAIGQSIRGSAVLIGHTRRFLALFEEPCLVHHQDPIRVPQVLHHIAAQFIADRLFIPVGFSQQALGPVRITFAQFLGQLPAIFALHGSEQRAQVATCSAARLRPAKVGANALLHLGQFLARLLQHGLFGSLLFALLTIPGHALHLLASSLPLLPPKWGCSTEYYSPTLESEAREIRAYTRHIAFRTEAGLSRGVQDS
jgi:hypothetical protein